MMTARWALNGKLTGVQLWWQLMFMLHHDRRWVLECRHFRICSHICDILSFSSQFGGRLAAFKHRPHVGLLLFRRVYSDDLWVTIIDWIAFRVLLACDLLGSAWLWCELDLLGRKTRYVWLLAILWAYSHLRCLSYMRHGHSSWLLDGNSLDFLRVVVCHTLVLRIANTAAMLLQVWLYTLTALNFDRIKTYADLFKAILNFQILADWSFTFLCRQWKKPIIVVFKNRYWFLLDTFCSCCWLRSQSTLSQCSSPTVTLSHYRIWVIYWARLILLMLLMFSTIFIVVLVVKLCLALGRLLQRLVCFQASLRILLSELLLRSPTARLSTKLCRPLWGVLQLTIVLHHDHCCLAWWLLITINDGNNVCLNLIILIIRILASVWVDCTAFDGGSMVLCLFQVLIRISWLARDAHRVCSIFCETFSLTL